MTIINESGLYSLILSSKLPKAKEFKRIDRAMNKIPELYDIAIKLYENDVNALVQEIYELNEASNDQYKKSIIK